jgi:hypothetical protein
MPDNSWLKAFHRCDKDGIPEDWTAGFDRSDASWWLALIDNCYDIPNSDCIDQTNLEMVRQKLQEYIDDLLDI